MATYQKFEELEIWQLARIFCKDIYDMIENSPIKTNYRLANQIDAASGSIMDNIAEGFERGGNREFIQFLYIAKASCGEVRSQLYRILDRNFIDEKLFEKLKNQVINISRKIGGFITYLEKSNYTGTKYKNR